MKYFSTPSDFKKETIDKFDELNKKYNNSKITETYGQLTDGTFLNSGRVTSVLPKVDIKSLEEYIKYSADRNISFSYTLNPSCTGNLEFSREGIKRIKLLLKSLIDVGVKNITVSTPSLIELIHEFGYKFSIKASAICEITSPDKAAFYKKLGVKRLVVDPDITRDFQRLSDICTVFGEGVEIIVNNVCMKNCAYKMYHYNHEAHCTSENDSQLVKDYYFNRCSMQKASDSKNAIKLNWIRPEDLTYYNACGIRHYKIQGRQNVTKGNIVKALDHYMKEDYCGNLFDLITIFAPYNAFQPYIDNKKLDGFLHAFFANPMFCRGICSQCNYCDSYSFKSMDIDSVLDINKKSMEFYNKYDNYNKLLKKEKENEIITSLFDSTDMDFDFKY